MDIEAKSLFTKQIGALKSLSAPQGDRREREEKKRFGHIPSKECVKMKVLHGVYALALKEF